MTTAVDTPASVMWSIRQIAERDNVTRQLVSKKVIALVRDHGLTVGRDERGRVASVNVVEYDRLRGRFGDPSKAQAPKREAGERAPIKDAESLDEARRIGAWQDVERKRLEMAEGAGKLVRRDMVAGAVTDCAQRIAQMLDRLPNSADTLATAVAREGQHGLRTALRKLANRMRTDIAEALQQVAANAPAQDTFDTGAQDVAEDLGGDLADDIDAAEPEPAK